MVIQWLELSAFAAVTPIQSLFRELKIPEAPQHSQKKKKNPAIFLTNHIKRITIVTCLPLRPVLPILDFNFVNGFVKPSDFPFKFFHFFPNSAVWSESYHKPVLDKVFFVNLLEDEAFFAEASNSKCFCLFVLALPAAGGLSVPPPGIKPLLSAVKPESKPLGHQGIPKQ